MKAYNNIEPTFFSEQDVNELIDAAPATEKLSGFLAGHFNKRIKRILDALNTETNHLDQCEKNYQRALGQIEGLKFSVEVQAQKNKDYN